MKKIDVADEVAQQECNNNKCYASAYIYIYIYIYVDATVTPCQIQLELNFIIFLKCPKYFKKSGIWLKSSLEKANQPKLPRLILFDTKWFFFFSFRKI